MTAAGALATTEAPAAADGRLVDEWTWTGNYADNIARTRYVEYYRMNNSNDAALPDNLDIYGTTCVTVPYTIGRVEMTQTWQIDTVGVGGLSLSAGGVGAGFSLSGNNVNYSWGVDKPAWDGVQTHWSACSNYAKGTAFGNGNVGDPGRVHVTTTWQARMTKVRHRTSLNYFSQFGPIHFATDPGEERGPWCC
jgi:hypothetical protein